MTKPKRFHDPVLGWIEGYDSAEEFNAAVEKWNAEHANEPNPFTDEMDAEGIPWRDGR